MIIEISNNVDSSLDSVIEKTLLDGAHMLIGKGALSDMKEVQLSVAVVGPDEIKKLNRQYRKKDEPTDVLSFAYENTEKELQGEIIVCPEVIKRNAKEDGIKFEHELKKNLIHGFLHILGYEHGDEMFGLQDDVCQSI